MIETKRGPGRPRLYPWRDWFARRRFLLRRGVDYHCRTDSMAQMVRNVATQRELSVSILQMADAILVVVDREDADA